MKGPLEGVILKFSIFKESNSWYSKVPKDIGTQEETDWDIHVGVSLKNQREGDGRQRFRKGKEVSWKAHFRWPWSLIQC